MGGVRRRLVWQGMAAESGFRVSDLGDDDGRGSCLGSTSRRSQSSRRGESRCKRARARSGALSAQPNRTLANSESIGFA
jgi:hypothetical protein